MDSISVFFSSSCFPQKLLRSDCFALCWQGVTLTDLKEAEKTVAKAADQAPRNIQPVSPIVTITPAERGKWGWMLRIIHGGTECQYLHHSFAFLSAVSISVKNLNHAEVLWCNRKRILTFFNAGYFLISSKLWETCARSRQHEGIWRELVKFVSQGKCISRAAVCDDSCELCSIVMHTQAVCFELINIFSIPASDAVVQFVLVPLTCVLSSLYLKLWQHQTERSSSVIQLMLMMYFLITVMF